MELYFSKRTVPGSHSSECGERGREERGSERGPWPWWGQEHAHAVPRQRIRLSPVPGIEGKQEVLVCLFFMLQCLLPGRTSNFVHIIVNLAHPLTSLASLVQCLVPSGHKGAAKHSPKDPKGGGRGRRFSSFIPRTLWELTVCALHTAPCKEQQKRPTVPALTELSGKEAKALGVR